LRGIRFVAVSVSLVRPSHATRILAALLARSESGRPLTENEPGPAGCGVHEDQVGRFDGINLPDQHLSVIPWSIIAAA
jgi:hypothetical protein